MSLFERLALTLLLAAVAAAAAADTKPAKPSGPPTWYAQALTRGEAGLNVTHFWSKGPWLRAETVVAAHKIVTIVRGDRYYAYDGLTGSGVAIRREPAAIADDRPDRRPFAREYEILTQQGAELVREETLVNRRAGIYRVTDAHGRRELWVTQDELRMPLRVEIFDRDSGEQRTVDYVNWQSDLAIDDSFFTPDTRASLEEMDYTDYLRRSTEQGSVGPVPVFYTNLLYKREAATKPR
jgi:outer membrane lipoprotein-sorting protein